MHLRTLVSRLGATFHRRRLENEFDEEVREHLDLLAQRFAARGMTAEQARGAARRQFGGVTQIEQELRERRGFVHLDALARDVRHACRRLRQAKWFTASAALTLGLGIGAGTAIFAVFDAVVLKPLPYAEPGRLMAFQPMDQRGVPHPVPVSYPDFFEFRAQSRAAVFEHLVSYRREGFALTDTLPAIRVAGEIVSWDLFPMLGVQPALGRGFLKDEEKPGTNVVVLSHALWKNRFGGDPGILGRRVRINQIPHTVVGVAPAGFRFPVEEVELWTTLAGDGFREQRGSLVLGAIGRLKPGVTPEGAEVQMNRIAEGLARQYPDHDKNRTSTMVTPVLERLVGDVRKPLWILLGAVTLVLLIACANVANLLLARSIERGREFALRTAMGASRAALVRQLLIESLLLGVAGCAGGVLLAGAALRWVLPLAGDSVGVPRLLQAEIDLRVLAFAMLAALSTAVLFGLAPAAQAAGVDLAGTLKEGATNIARGHHRLRSALVVGQMTLGLVLLVGAGLLGSSFLYLLRRDSGFRPANLLAFEVARNYDEGQSRFCGELMERLRAIPGVRAAAAGTPLPLEGQQMSVGFDIEERPAPAAQWPDADIAVVTPGYFGVLGIPLLKGRDFTWRDDAGAPRVVIVNEAFARTFFPGEEALGKRIKPGMTTGNEDMVFREIVGVVGNARQMALETRPEPIYYYPFQQLPMLGTIVLRTDVAPLGVEQAARRVVMGLDREAPIHHVRSGEEMAASAITVPRFLMVLMGGFAGIALLLTAVGLYGVLSYAVARRRREIGVRIALGARRGEVVGLVLRDAMKLVAAGTVLGVAGAAAAGRLLESMVHGIQPRSPAFLAAACAVMAVVSLAAAYLPAWRAAKVDPIQALRSE